MRRSSNGPEVVSLSYAHTLMTFATGTVRSYYTVFGEFPSETEKFHQLWPASE